MSDNNLVFLQSLVEEKKRKVLQSKTKPEFHGEILVNDEYSNLSEDTFTVTLQHIGDQINVYRRLQQIPEVDFAITEIVNEMVIDTTNEVPVRPVFNSAEMKDNLKKKIEECFDIVANRLKFRDNLEEWARSFYVEGRLYLEKIRDNSGKIKELRYIDPTKIVKVVKYKRVGDEDNYEVEIVDEFFWYSPKANNLQYSIYGNTMMVGVNDDPFENQIGRRLKKSDVVFIHSGLIDRATGYIYGFLHKAIRPANMLSLMEDSTIVYRITRAPEKRAFYVDTGNMSPERALQHLQQLKNQYKRQIQYDPITGSVKDNKHLESIQDDYWLARRFGQRATEITTIAGPQNSSIGDSEEIKYFQEKLYKSLNIPPSRFMEEGATVLLGMQNEISREERKFIRFIYKLRRRFSEIFYQVLRNECIKENVLDANDWVELEPFIEFEWQNDSYYEEAKRNEILSNRLDMAERLLDFETFPRKWIEREILKLDEKQLEELERMRTEEADDGDDDSEDESQSYGNRGRR